MKKIISTILIFSFATSIGTAETVKQKLKNKKQVVKTVQKQAPNKKVLVAAVNSPKSAALKKQLLQAVEMAKSGQYQNAANALFALGRRQELQSERAQIKYILGMMLMEMKLHQVAAFQFVDVIRLNHPKYTKQAIEKLSIVADTLGDDTLLNYAINRVDVNDIPAQNRDMINFRIGEVQLNNKDYARAEQFFAQVQMGSSYYNQALYNKGLAELEQNKADEAIKSFRYLLSVRSKAGVTDTNKVAAQIAIARALYQKHDWDASIEAYSQVPRDHFMWHDALFEQSWAMLRSARFRSALSNFQSLHSAYYEDFYIPESLLLRAIVYLYICKYDEMEKVLGLYEKTYGPVRAKMTSVLNGSHDPQYYFEEINKAFQYKKGGEMPSGLQLPYIVLKNILDEGDVRRSFNYIKALGEERARIEANFSFKATPLGQYGLKIISNRTKNTKVSIGEQVKNHLVTMRAELHDLYEQAGFIRYEMINGKKEVLKKHIAGKDLIEQPIDQKQDRKFYIENGYEYYPFQGEYWLDEIGNYHYLGKQSCE